MNLTTDPIPKLVRQLAIPAATGFFFSTMYNIVDTFYAGKLSSEALEALGYSFAVFFILTAVASGVGQGSTALISNLLGSKNSVGARLMSQQTIGFGILVGITISILGWLSCPFLFKQLRATGQAYELGLIYMNYILLGSPFFILQGVLNASLQSSGDTASFRNFLIAGFIANLVLDPWFMFGAFGVPAMGIKGVAIATAGIQVCGCIYLWIKVKKLDWRRGSTLAELQPRMEKWKEIIEQGFPASVNMLTVALGIFVINWFLSGFSKESIAGYIVATRIEQIVLVPTIGFNIAILSLVGQNNGAGRLDRVRESWSVSMKYGFFTMLCGGIALFFLRGPLMKIFTNDPEIIIHGKDYLVVASITLFAYVILFQTVFMLQGLKRPAYALWIGLYRQIVAPVSAFWFLGYYLGWRENGVWWGVFVVTWSAALFTLWYGGNILKKLEAMKALETK